MLVFLILNVILPKDLLGMGNRSLNLHAQLDMYVAFVDTHSVTPTHFVTR